MLKTMKTLWFSLYKLCSKSQQGHNYFSVHFEAKGSSVLPGLSPAIPFLNSKRGLKSFKKETQHKTACPILLISLLLAGKIISNTSNSKETIARKAKLMTKAKVSSLVTRAFQNTVLIF